MPLVQELSTFVHVTGFINITSMYRASNFIMTVVDVARGVNKLTLIGAFAYALDDMAAKGESTRMPANINV